MLYLEAIKVRTILAFFLLIASQLSLSEPVIERLEFKQDTNEAIITGSNFGRGPKFVMFENFEKEDLFSKRYSVTGGGWYDDVITLKEDDQNFAHRAKDPSQALLGKNVVAKLKFQFGKPYTEAFISFSVKTPKGTTFAGASEERTFPEVSSWKFIWLFGGADGFTTDDNLDLALPTHAGKGSFLLGGNNGILGWIENGNKWWDWDNYNHMSTYVKFNHNDPNEGPVQYFWTVSNSKMFLTNYDEAPPSNFNSSNLSFDSVNIPGWWGNGDNSNFDGLYDNIYIAAGESALARIALTDKENIQGSKTLINIPAESWDNNQIIINLDVVNGNEEYYLHVIDENDNVSESSVKFCPRCPVMAGE